MSVSPRDREDLIRNCRTGSNKLKTKYDSVIWRKTILLVSHPKSIIEKHWSIYIYIYDEDKSFRYHRIWLELFLNRFHVLSFVFLLKLDILEHHVVLSKYIVRFPRKYNDILEDRLKIKVASSYIFKYSTLFKTLLKSVCNSTIKLQV